MVPQLPGSCISVLCMFRTDVRVDRRKGPAPAERPAADEPRRDRPALRAHADPHLRGRVQRRDRVLEPRYVARALCSPVRVLTARAEFVSPAAVRSAAKREKAAKYGSRKDAQIDQSKRKEGRKRPEDELAVSGEETVAFLAAQDGAGADMMEEIRGSRPASRADDRFIFAGREESSIGL